MDFFFKKIDTKFPLYFSAGSFAFIYIIQYLIAYNLGNYDETQKFTLSQWFIAYSFVLISLIIFFTFLYIGISGKKIRVKEYYKTNIPWKKVSLFNSLGLIFLFFAWSFLMLQLKIGMTIYTDFDPLPFKTTGILFYGRLFFQPLVLIYIANSFRESKLRYLFLILMTGLAVWTSLVSGSRFIAILFSLPMLFLFKGNARFVYFILILNITISIASLSRNFFLPFRINDDMYIQIYANEDYQATALKNASTILFDYATSRIMGINEVLLTLNAGEITTSIQNSFISFFSNFIPFLDNANSISAKNIFGFDDQEFGGLGLDFFSNFYLLLGGTVIGYTLGLTIISWLAGRSYYFLASVCFNFKLEYLAPMIYLIIFILLAEGRLFIFPYMFMFSWVISQNRVISFLQIFWSNLGKPHFVQNRV